MKVKLDKAKLKDLVDALQNSERAVYIKDLAGLTCEGICSICDIVPRDKQIRVGLCNNIPKATYDKNFGPYKYEGGFAGQTLAHYTIDELIVALDVMESIEAQIDDSWSDKEKAIFLWGYIASNFDHKAYKGTNDYVFFEQRQGTCTDFSKGLNNLLIRQGIESYCFACDIHAFNMVNIDGKFYPVDADVSASNKLINGFGRKGYFSLPELIDIYDYIQADSEQLNSNYFEDNEIFEILDKVLPSYNKKRHSLQEKEDGKTH